MVFQPSIFNSLFVWGSREAHFADLHSLTSKTTGKSRHLDLPTKLFGDLSSTEIFGNHKSRKSKVEMCFLIIVFDFEIPVTLLFDHLDLPDLTCHGLN